MRKLNSLLRGEGGATAVLVGLLMVPLVGLLAVGLTLGAVYWEDAQLQNGADAAALAVAKLCADNHQTSSCTGDAAMATNYAGLNASDNASGATVSYPSAASCGVSTSGGWYVRVDTRTGSGPLSLPLGGLIGAPSSVTRTASACAQWGFPQSTSPLLPITISLCDFQPALNGTRQLIQYANPQSNQPCPRGSGLPPGGFGWIDETGCVVTVHNGSLNGEPGNSYPNDCDAVMNSLAGKTVLVPVFDSVTGTGNNAVYHVYGFAAFVITGWKFSGGSGLPQVLNDPAAPSCTGSCRGIQGYFTHWAAPVGGQLGGVDLGLTVINLVR